MKCFDCSIRVFECYIRVCRSSQFSPHSKECNFHGGLQEEGFNSLSPYPLPRPQPITRVCVCVCVCTSGEHIVLVAILYYKCTE